MDTRHIRHFMALVECGSFARASEVVHLSQPALSRSIQELERQLGARLFDRGRFGVVLTAHGRAALPHVRGLLAAAESLRQEVEAIDELETGELNTRIMLRPHDFINDTFTFKSVTLNRV